MYYNASAHKLFALTHIFTSLQQDTSEFSERTAVIPATLAIVIFRYSTAPHRAVMMTVAETLTNTPFDFSHCNIRQTACLQGKIKPQ